MEDSSTLFSMSLLGAVALYLLLAQHSLITHPLLAAPMLPSKIHSLNCAPNFLWARLSYMKMSPMIAFSFSYIFKHQMESVLLPYLSHFLHINKKIKNQDFQCKNWSSVPVIILTHTRKRGSVAFLVEFQLWVLFDNSGWYNQTDKHWSLFPGNKLNLFY